MSERYIVRHGHLRLLGGYLGLEGHEHARGERVVVRSERGTELGEVIGALREVIEPLLDRPREGAIHRLATAEDEEVQRGLVEQERDAFRLGQEAIGARGMHLDLVDVEAILGGERLVFYYLAEGRVDFRELVKDLARACRTRIEMRQIGVRDEARLLADYGDCGKPVCCNTHLTRMPPITMRMAKLQKTTLDPAKISGRCGRLKCCLRYEYDHYQESERVLPPPNARVLTTRGRGKVLAQRVLSRKVLVELESQSRVVMGPEEILSTESTRGRAARRDLQGPHADQSHEES